MKKEITRLRKLRKGKNNVEIKRIDIAIELLKGKGYKEIKKEMSCGESTISYVKKNYKKDKEKFYKTKYKGAKEKFGKEYSSKIIKYIEERSENNKGCTIRDIVDFLGLERNKKSYEFVWYMTRRKNNLNYQKPYVQDKKSPKNAKEILKKNIKESMYGNKFETLCRNRFEKKNILEENKDLINRFELEKEKDIKEGNYEVDLQDESSFEIDKKTNRILMIKGKKIKLELEALLHDGFKICGFLDMAGKSILQIMKGGKGDDFRDMLIEFDNKKNNNKLKILIVDNYVIHFTINVLLEALKRKILIIPLPKYSPELNPIEQLWRILKREVRTKYKKLKDMKEGVLKFAKNNLFSGLVKNYWIKYISPDF